MELLVELNSMPAYLGYQAAFTATVKEVLVRVFLSVVLLRIPSANFMASAVAELLLLLLLVLAVAFAQPSSSERNRNAALLDGFTITEREREGGIELFLQRSLYLSLYVHAIILLWKYSSSRELKPL